MLFGMLGQAMFEGALAEFEHSPCRDVVDYVLLESVTLYLEYLISDD